MAKMKKNIVESVRAKLLNIAKENKTSLDFIVLRYMQEKLLKRVFISRYKDNFVLKGGLFFLITKNINPRVTKDIDFLGISIVNKEKEIKEIFQEILSTKIEEKNNDALIFETSKIICEPIIKDADYKGIRVNIVCSLGVIKKNLQVDIGHGDVVYPHVNFTNFPSLLDSELENIAAYTLESVIAEKFEAMVKLSYSNSRMKDFYDIYNICKNYNINGEEIKNAIALTFKKRETSLEQNDLDIFKDEFYMNEKKIIQWNSFIKKINISDLEFNEVMFLLKSFLSVIVDSIKNNSLLEKRWDCISCKWID